MGRKKQNFVPSRKRKNYCKRECPTLWSRMGLQLQWRLSLGTRDVQGSLVKAPLTPSDHQVPWGSLGMTNKNVNFVLNMGAFFSALISKQECPKGKGVITTISSLGIYILEKDRAQHWESSPKSPAKLCNKIGCLQTIPASKISFPKLYVSSSYSLEGGRGRPSNKI